MVESHGVAATVVLLRDGAAGLEVLLLERPRSRGSFAGAWVFPGGAVDPGDSKAGDGATGDGGASGGEAGEAEEERAARRAAVRETREETGVELAERELAPVAVWSPPVQATKRMRTWFYYAAASAGAASGEIRLATEELIDFRWMLPNDALAAHAVGELELVAPTWITLFGLATAASVADAMHWARSTQLDRRHTRLAASGTTLVWEGDIAHSDDALLDADGPRHRLHIADLPWVYQRLATSGEH